MSPFDFISWKVFNDLGHWVAVIALGVWSYLRTKDNDNAAAVKQVAADSASALKQLSRDNASAVQKVAGELAEFIKASGDCNSEQNLQINTLKELVKHMPTDKEVQRVAEDVSSMKSRIEGQGDLLKRLEHQTNLIHEHLLKNR